MTLFTRLFCSRLIKYSTILLFTLPVNIFAQAVLSDDSLHSITSINDFEDSKKSISATEGSWSADSYGSDYWVYFRWEGIVSPCACSPAVTYIAFNYYGGAEVLRVNSPPATYLTKTYRAGLTPGISAAYTLAAPYTGKTYNIATWFDCWYGCSGTITSSSHLYAITANLKAPTNPAAINKIADTRIDVTWHIGTEVPKDKHSYKIYKDDVYTGTIVAGTATLKYSDTNVEPGMSHNYSIRTRYVVGTKEMLSSAASATGTAFHLNLEATTELKTSIDLDWEYAGGIGATGFRIERQEPSGSWIEIGHLPAALLDLKMTVLLY